MIKTVALSLSLFFAVAIFGYLFIAERNIDFGKVDKIANTFIKNYTFPGAVLNVAKSNKLFYEKAYGYQTYPGDEFYIADNTETIFDMASVTKVVVTTSCIMHMYDTNLLSLDDPMVKYIPEANNNGKD